MPCFHPITGYKGKSVNKKTGKRAIVFKVGEAFTDLPVVIPCGRCHGCRLERSRQWAIRCVHEASLHEENAFITLTYDDAHLPSDGSLNKKHFQDFMKKYRRKLEPKKIRFYHCGEYGEELGRPHYHALIFGHDFEDKELYTEKKGNRLYISEKLNNIWENGACLIGEVTFDSAAYVARYIMKKITGDKAEEHYKTIDIGSGEITDLVPEYTTMSRGGKGGHGIGHGWYEKWKAEVYPDDFIVINGRKMKPPDYYKKFFQKEAPEKYVVHSKIVKEKNRKHKKDQTPARLMEREECSKAKMKLRERDLK